LTDGLQLTDGVVKTFFSMYINVTVNINSRFCNSQSF